VLCALVTLAAGNLCDADGDELLCLVAAELHLSGLQLSLAARAVRVVVNVKHGQLNSWTLVGVVVASRLGDTARAFTFADVQYW